MRKLKDWCSFSPDFNFGSCCEQHDSAYSKGSLITRKIADKDLRLCIACNAHIFVAWFYWLGVRAVGWLLYKGKA